MVTTLYDEAIADVKKLREIAEQKAKDSLLQKVEPRIKLFVEQQLFGADDEDEDDEEDSASAEVTEAVVETSATDAVQGVPSQDEHVHSESCSEDCGSDKDSNADVLLDEQCYELDESSSTASLLASVTVVNEDRFVADVYRTCESVQMLITTDKQGKLAECFIGKIDSCLSKLEDMYVYLREGYSGNDSELLDRKLERSYGLAQAIKESTMRMKELLKEDNLTVTFNNLPDDVDLDAVTVDIVNDEAAEADEQPADDVDQVESDSVAQTAPDDEQEIEISESVLNHEIARIKRLSESSKSDSSDATARREAARERLKHTRTRLSEARTPREKQVASTLHRLAVRNFRRAVSKSRHDVADPVRPTLDESVQRTQKTSALEVKNTSSGRSATDRYENRAKFYARKLEEANLLNAKLIQANKLLRLEGITKAQQIMVIDRLDEARSLREVRLISENLSAALRNRSTVNESTSRQSVGSASRASQSGSTSSSTLNESLETSRWEILAGIK